MTPNLDQLWMTQQARNLTMLFDEQGEYKPTHIIRDRDTQVNGEVLRDAGRGGDRIPADPVAVAKPKSLCRGLGAADEA